MILKAIEQDDESKPAKIKKINEVCLINKLFLKPLLYCIKLET